MTTQLSSTGDGRRVIIDAEHFSIRFLVPIIALGAGLLTHFGGRALLDRLLDSIDPLCIVLPLDVVAVVGVGYGAEYLLKRLMPSRRTAALSDDALVVTDGRRDPPVVGRIDWQRTFNVKAWRFAVRRRTRIPKGWYCLAVHLLQDETEIILYTFMSPGDAEAIIGYDQFVRLRPRSETQSNQDLSTAAEQRRLLKLEDARWNDGGEISQDDFRALLAILQRRLPGWA
ncbi:MAG: hypothetical protein GX573_08445 [Chloroflexi bacterium]|nr:hypothetical protein [Chloroflexota bacterium]